MLEQVVELSLKAYYKDKLEKIRRLVLNNNKGVDLFNSALTSYRGIKLLNIIRQLSRYIAHFKKQRLDQLNTTTL